MGYFGKVLETNFLTKVAQTSGDFLGYLQRCHYLSRHNCGYFLGNFRRTRVTLYSINWSHLVGMCPVGELTVVCYSLSLLKSFAS